MSGRWISVRQFLHRPRHQTELVAFRIGQDDPTDVVGLTDVEPRRSEVEEPRELGSRGRPIRPEIEADSID